MVLIQGPVEELLAGQAALLRRAPMRLNVQLGIVVHGQSIEPVHHLPDHLASDLTRVEPLHQQVVRLLSLDAVFGLDAEDVHPEPVLPVRKVMRDEVVKVG